MFHYQYRDCKQQMSWYLFKESPAIQHRGKKIQGFNMLPKPKINLSWGMNQPLDSRPPSNYSTNPSPLGDTVPATITTHLHNSQNEGNVKVLTDTSDDQQEELIKLIKSHREKKLEQEVMEHFNRHRKKSDSVQHSQAGITVARDNRSVGKAGKLEMDKRIRYLENSLLPQSRRNSMAAILDQELHRELPLEESRMSGKSVLHNKKNQSTLAVGDGYNHFIPQQAVKKDHLDKLRDQYQYEQLCKRRMQRSNINFG